MLTLISVALLLTSSILPALAWDVKPFKINIPPDEVHRMNLLVSNAQFPKAPSFTGGNETWGVELETIETLRSEWLHNFDWYEQQTALNKFNQFTVEIENVTVHFVHEKSAEPDAIPLIMFHGWPGSFHEWLPTVKPLTDRAVNAQGNNISFNVVVPSLPGFGFSSLPSAEWTNEDSARIFNTLMVDVLGYKTYTAFGSDWGSQVAYILYANYASTVRAAQFCFIPFLPPTTADAQSANISLSAFEITQLKINDAFAARGMAYFDEQEWRPNTIGLALYDSPVGQLTWMYELWTEFSDPKRGTGPSVLNDTAILTSISLYYLSKTFLSSSWIYSQNFLPSNFDVPRPATPMGFSAFPYNLGFPRAYIEKVGNLTFLHEHERGGHFPGLDNPAALVADIQEIGGYYVE
ncbi:alpha/beta-hydrolase [Punctularia strigosozonata HHB-11173 SS5]|uniref:alpha/beta-hydrolase n=1 Tax=Punctularia strigosozonata (strain HHB-11173) TaxID=741275 RepID=UPI0004416F4C|nr:alpha/beta-hydrolase [Punctularia strigosozonata HHB-11173 SS5]EIN09136.1 alpha/beta-hydrolase [Punctularia strigosozonata HHB-11173 SS5]